MTLNEKAPNSEEGTGLSGDQNKALKAAPESYVGARAGVTDNPQRYLSVTDGIPPSGDNEKEQSLKAAVARLASLSPLEYDRVRKQKAANLDVRIATLDQAVKDARKDYIVDSDLPFKEIEPWPGQIHPAELLSEITAAVRRFIVCNEEISNAVALWVAMTWFMDVVHIAPLAVITAPEKRCGKSLLLTILGKLTYRPITASSISPAALFQAIDAWVGLFPCGR